MKILLIGNEYYQQFPVLNYGGIETCVENLAKGLNQSNIEFEVIVPEIEHNNINYPFIIHEVENLPAFKSGISPKIFINSVKKYIIRNQLKFDVIWSQSNWSADGLHDLNKPIICTIHDSDFNMVKNNEIKYYKNVKYRFVSNTLLKNNFDNFENKELENICFPLFTGLEEKEYEFYSKKENYFLWVAGLNWGWTNKGLDMFIQLSKDYNKSDFICYGFGNKEIEDKLVSLSGGNFHYMGSLERGQKHKDVFGKAKKFMMLTRLNEAFGRTTIESFSKGTPVIGTKIGANIELIENFVGEVIETYDDLIYSLEKEYDYKKIYEYSKKFHVQNEIAELFKHSMSIL